MSKNLPKILIIEDEKSLLQAFTDKFKNQGFDVLAADEGHSALALAAIQHPDMIIVDLNTPQTEILAKKLYELKWADRIPLMFLNSWEDSQPKDKKIKIIDEYLAFNWSLEEVVQKVKNKLAIKNFKTYGN